MLSNLGEEVTLNSKIEVTDVVENWLDELNRKMVTTLQELLGKIDPKAEDKF